MIRLAGWLFVILTIIIVGNTLVFTAALKAYLVGGFVAGVAACIAASSILSITAFYVNRAFLNSKERRTRNQELRDYQKNYQNWYRDGNVVIEGDLFE